MERMQDVVALRADFAQPRFQAYGVDHSRTSMPS
jgi:hypothetical protein